MSTPQQQAAEDARRWRAALPREWRKSSTAYGTALALITFAVWVGTFLGFFLLPSPWMRLACAAASPMLIGSLFVIGHDAAHNSLTPIGWLNRVLGRLVFLPAYHPFTSWVQAHNTLHHGWTCFKGKHPDFAPLTKAEYDALPWWGRMVERFYRSPLGVGPNYAIDFWVGALLFPSKAKRSPFTLWFHLDRLLVLSFLVAQCALAWHLSTRLHGERAAWWVIPHAALGVFLPWTLWLWFMGFMSYIQHTHPLCAWYDDEEEWTFYHVQLKSTTHVIFPWPIEPLLNNITDHTAHHLDPAIPLYNLPQSQKLLEETAADHAIVVRWTLREYLRTTAACKLYDFDRHCWTDFDGNPTSPLNLPALLLRPQAKQETPLGASS